MHELRIWDHDEARGIDEGGRHRHITLDPNQVYELVENDDPHDPEQFLTEETWDAQANAKVIVTVIRPRLDYRGDDPYAFGKAESRYLDEHNVTQDALGRFVAEGADVADILRGEPRLRQSRQASRQQRQQRQHPVSERSHERALERSRGRQPERAASTRQLVRELAARSRQEYPQPDFAPGQHLVLSGDEWRSILQTQLHSGTIDTKTGRILVQPTSVRLDPTWTVDLRDSMGSDPAETFDLIVHHHHEFAVEMHHKGLDTWLNDDQAIRLPYGDVDVVHRTMLFHLSRYMEIRPDINEFAVELRPEGDEIAMDIYGVRNPHIPVVVTNHVEDWDAPVMLKRVTDKRLEAPIPTTPFSRDHERDTGIEPRFLTFTRPEHERYELRNASGHKPGQRG